MKTILYIGPVPPPTGGVALSLQNILRCEQLQHYRQQVFNTSDGQRTETVGRKGLTVRRVWRRLRMASAIAALVVRTRPDLIHFQCGSESTANIVGDMLMVWASRICRAPVIFHLHVDPSTSGLPGRGQFGGWLFRQLMRHVHSILVLTEGYRDFLLTVCKLPQPVYVAPNMCDEQLLKIARQREHQPDVVRVVFLGRLTEAKGIFDLLAVAACLRSTGLRLCFEVAGLPSTDEEEAQLKEIVEREQLHDLVHFHGLVTSRDKLALFENGHIVFIPSHSESFGIVAIEGMAAGLPVLATDVGGLRSIVLQNTTGYLVRPGDIEAMATSLAQLASAPQLRTQMGCAGRQRFVDRYSSTVVGKVIGAAYAHALEYA